MNAALRLCWTALLALALLLPAARAEVPVPPLQARVTDLTNTLPAAERQALEQQLAAFEQRKGVQIAVLLVPTTAPETIEQYSIRVVDAWQLGRRGVDDGILLLIATNDRALRIEVGYGLEGVVPDAIAKRIVDDVIVPYFRAGDFVGGIRAGVDRLMRVIEGEPLPAPAGKADQPSESPLPYLLFAFFVISGLLGRLLGRLVGAAVTGGVIGLLFWLMAGSLAAAVAVAALAFVAALFTGGGIGPGGYYGGGVYGRRGGLGGGFGGGGFRGGGGGFGGGGASGRW